MFVDLVISYLTTKAVHDFIEACIEFLFYQQMNGL